MEAEKQLRNSKPESLPSQSSPLSTMFGEYHPFTLIDEARLRVSEVKSNSDIPRILTENYLFVLLFLWACVCLPFSEREGKTGCVHGRTQSICWKRPVKKTNSSFKRCHTEHTHKSRGKGSFCDSAWFPQCPGLGSITSYPAAQILANGS